MLREFPLIIGIVDRIKINYSKQLFPFSESELSTLSANCTFRHILRLFRLFRGGRSGMDKSSLATCLVYSDGVKGSQVAKEISRKGRRGSREKGNQGVGGFRFINILHFFYFFNSLHFLFFLLNFFFTHDICPHPRPTPTTHDLYPLHLATLGKPWTLEISQECLLCYDQSQQRSGHTN